MKKLYVGFKGIHNSSYKLVNHFQGNKLFLTNSFEGLKRDIENLEEQYEQVYMFGLDKTLKNSVRLEKCAEKNGDTVCTQMALFKIEQKLLQSGINYKVSENPTHYLCNEAYYYMLKRMSGNAVFIHIPSLKNLTEDLLQNIISVFQ